MTTTQLIEKRIVTETEFKQFCGAYDVLSKAFYSRPDETVLNGFYGKVLKHFGFKNWSVIQFEGAEVLNPDDEVLFFIQVKDCPVKVKSVLPECFSNN